MKKKKTRALVAKHVEHLKGEALEGNYKPLIRHYVYKKSGIYALYRKNKLYYVGLATNLNGRLMRHHIRDRHAGLWDEFSVYLTPGTQYLKEIEALVLRIASPKGNLQKGKFKRSVDLLRQIDGDIKIMQKLERTRIGTSRLRHHTSSHSRRHKRKHRLNNSHEPTLAPYIKKRIHIRFNYKGNLYVAHVRKDGTITFGSETHRARKLMGPVYTSPSMAARAVTKRSIDGWLNWKYKNRKGEWVKLDELRK
ncbi:MAG: hypothetical protein ABII64_08355 [Elusimicrobiota bacterium]